MNYENAMRLYTKALRTLINAEMDGCNKHEEISTSVAHLRQSLSCYVCYGLLDQPCSNVESTCQHYLCQGCVGGKLRLPSGSRPTCSWCKDPSKFQPDEHLVALLSCYGNLCRYIAGSRSLHGTDNKNSLLDLISEGLNLPSDQDELVNRKQDTETAEAHVQEESSTAKIGRKGGAKRPRTKEMQTDREDIKRNRRPSTVSPVKSRLRSADHSTKK